MSTPTSTPRDAVRPPTTADVHRGLRGVLGEAKADRVWVDLTRSLGLEAGAPVPDDDFDELLTLLGRHDGLGRALALSWRVRRGAALQLAGEGR